jgi:hypothetical protein
MLIDYNINHDEFEFKGIDGKFFKNDKHSVVFGYIKYDGEDNEKEYSYVLSCNKITMMWIKNCL